MTGIGLTDGVLTRRTVLAIIGGSMLSAGMAGCTGGAQAADEPPAQDEPTASAAARPEVVEASIPAFHSAFAQLVAEGSVQSVRLIGDSITAGFGCDNYEDFTDNVIYEGAYGTFFESAPSVACWANDFRAWAGEKGLAGFVNAGISGAKMRWLAEDVDAWVREGADAIFVMLGTNDAVYFGEDEYRSDTEAALMAVADRCRHLVVMAPPANERTDSPTLYGADVLERVLSELAAAHGWEFVSLYGVLELGTDDYLFDQCHPTSAGSHKLWEHLRATLGL